MWVGLMKRGVESVSRSVGRPTKQPGGQAAVPCVSQTNTLHRFSNVPRCFLPPNDTTSKPGLIKKESCVPAGMSWSMRPYSLRKVGSPAVRIQTMKCSFVTPCEREWGVGGADRALLVPLIDRFVSQANVSVPRRRGWGSWGTAGGGNSTCRAAGSTRSTARESQALGWGRKGR